MYCVKCGTENSEDSTFCKKCGMGLSLETPTSHESYDQNVSVKPRKSKLAVASLVLSIVGILINPCIVLAIIFGGIAISKTGKDPSLSGRGMAIAGIVIGIIGAILWLIGLVYLFG
jgi:uncharacterized membrane protein YvbJ